MAVLGGFVCVTIALATPAYSALFGGPPLVPPEGFDLRYAGQQQAMAELIGRSLLRLERTVIPAGLDAGDADYVVDGAGILMPSGMLLSTASWLLGAKSLRVIFDGEPIGVATPQAAYPGSAETLMQLRFRGQLPKQMIPIQGISELHFKGSAPRMLMAPTQVGVSQGGIARVPVMWQGETLFAAGTRRSGVPLFDAHARLAALCDRISPDQLRSIVLPITALRPVSLPSKASQQENPSPTEAPHAPRTNQEPLAAHPTGEGS